MHPSTSLELRLQLGLAVAGALAGAVGGAALTVLGKIVAGAPPAMPREFVWNMTLFGVMAAVLSPLITWNGLRRVPLWRTIVEPLAAGVGGAVVGVLIGSGPLFLLLMPVCMGAAMLGLGWRYRDPAGPALPAPAAERILTKPSH